MNLTLTVLEIVSPVFLLAAIGFVWIRLGIEYRVQFVTQLAMTLSVPCLVFVALMQTEIDPDALARLSVATLAAYGGVTLFAWGLTRIWGLEIRTYLAPLIFGNTGNLGLPLALFAYGDLGLSYAVIVFAIMAIYSFTAGVWLVSGGGSPFKVLKEPLVWAAVLGGVFMLQGWKTPVFLTNTLELVGQMAIPLMLITLGVALARLSPAGLGRAAVLSVLKLVACVGIAWSAGLWFGLDPTAFGVLVLQIATPVAVTSYLLAEKYGAEAEAVAGLVVASTLICVVGLPLILAAVL